MKEVSCRCVQVIALALLWSTFEVDAINPINPFEEMTLVEDVVGAHELQSLKTMISNSTSKLTKAINMLAAGSKASLEEEKWRATVDSKNLVLQETVDTLKETMDDTKSYIEEVYDSIKKVLQTFKSQVLQNISNLKASIELQRKEMPQLLQKTDLASQQVLASDCLDLYNMHYQASGTYWLNKYGIKVLCDMETDGGGWLVIQRRAKVNKQVDFSQDWFTYKIGFGNLDTEFWIGNDILHMLTSQKTYELRIEMEDYQNGTFYASYNNFKVGSEEANYALDVGEYEGNASDAFTYHHGRAFSTKDRDHDNYVNGSCSMFFSGGWWYDRCYDAHLNGVYPDPPDRTNASFISWWSRNEQMEKVPLVLINVLIKIRPIIN